MLISKFIYPICETHKIEMTQRGGCPQEERYMGCKRFIGNCANCGREIIVPHTGINYGGVRNLKEDGFTGDIDSHNKKCYCFKCMKEVGWTWGEKEEDNRDKE